MHINTAKQNQSGVLALCICVILWPSIHCTPEVQATECKKSQYCFGVQSQTPHRRKAQSCGSQGMVARLNSQNAVYLFCRLFPTGYWSVSFRALLAVRLKCVFCFFDVVSGRIHCLLHTTHFLLYFAGTQ